MLATTSEICGGGVLQCKGGCCLVSISRVEWDVSATYGWVANHVRKTFEFVWYQFMNWLICLRCPWISWLINIYVFPSKLQATIHAPLPTLCHYVLSCQFDGVCQDYAVVVVCLANVQIGVWLYWVDVILPPRNKLKQQKHSKLLNPSMHVLAKLTQTLYKKFKGIEKIIWVNNL